MQTVVCLLGVGGVVKNKRKSVCIFRDFHLFNVFYQWLAESAPVGRIDAEGKMRNAEYLKHLNSIQILSSNRESVTGQASGCIMQSCLPF